MTDPHTEDKGVRDVPELAAWWPEQQPDNSNTRCRNGCCQGTYCVRTYLSRGAAAAIVEAYTPLRQTLLERLRAKFTWWSRSKGKP